MGIQRIEMEKELKEMLSLIFHIHSLQKKEKVWEIYKQMGIEKLVPPSLSLSSLKGELVEYVVFEYSNKLSNKSY